jgi:hypothetical protein
VAPMRVGITIATYKRPDNSTPAKLRRCLQSVANQAYGDWLVFLIGDHYESEAEFTDLAGQLPADKCVAVNLPVAAEREEMKLAGRALWCCGGTHAMNEALTLQCERGLRYTAHLDDDDYWEPDHLQRLMRAYGAMPDLAFVYAQAVCLGRRLPAVAGDYPQVPNNLPPRAFNLAHSSASWDMTKIPFGYTNCVAELRQVFPTDAYMWTRIASHCSARRLPTMFIPVVTVTHTREGSCLEAI